MTKFTKSFFILLVLMLGLTSEAFGLGGLDKAASTAQSIRDGIYNFVFIAAPLYLIYTVVLIKMEKKGWQDLISACIFVSLAGAAIVLVNWLWSLWA